MVYLDLLLKEGGEQGRVKRGWWHGEKMVQKTVLENIHYTHGERDNSELSLINLVYQRS